VRDASAAGQGVRQGFGTAPVSYSAVESSLAQGEMMS
jgi:hypothetical protein